MHTRFQFERRGLFMILVVALAIASAFFASTSRSEAQLPPPNPIDPNNGQQTLLNLVNGLPINNIQNALDNFPVPYVVIAKAGNATPTIINKKAGSPTRVDADKSKATGQGNSGHDIEVEVNTELLPTPRLVLSVNRLGTSNFATNLQVVVAFPFDAFNSEDGSAGGGSPNLFFGYQTKGPLLSASNNSYQVGGIAPQSVTYTIIPGVLAGTDHLLDLNIATTGTSNPIQFLGGHFEGAPGAVPQDVIGLAALADPVPATINLGLDISASAILGGGSTSAAFGIDWVASALSRVTFDYIEHETAPAGLAPANADYGTQVIADLMPTNESLDILVNYAAQTIRLQHSANSVIGALTVKHRRNDGLDIVAVAEQVPTSVDMTLGLPGTFVLAVNANTMDLTLTATQTGGFPGSSAFFGHPMKFLYVKAVDLPDMTAAYDGTAQRVTVTTPNPGEFIGSLAFVMDDDASTIASPLVELPPDQGPLGTGVGVPWDDANRHVFSLVDDGTHGTAAARLIGVDEANLSLTSGSVADIGEKYVVTLAAAKPLTAYVDLVDPAAKFLQGSGVADLEATCNVHDFPSGTVDFDLALPPPSLSFSLTTVPAGQVIDDIFCTGNIDALFFELVASDVPAGVDFTFTPADNAQPGGQGSLVLTTPSPVGKLGVRLWAPAGDKTLDDAGFATNVLLGAPLDDARFVAHSIPNITATWSDAADTSIVFDTPGGGVLGGLQVGVSTIQKFAAQFPNPTGSSGHFVTLLDKGGVLEKTVTAGAFGVDRISYTSDANGVALNYATNAARTLTVDVESNFGGHFFEDYFIDAVLVVNAVPQSFSFTSDLATALDYTASAGIAAIDINGDVDISNNAVDDRTTIDFDADGLPSEIHFQITPASGASLTAVGGPIDLISLDLSSNVGIFGSDYKHILGSIEDIPVSGWTAAWGTAPNLHAHLNAGAPLGPVSVILSKDVKANTPGKYAPFQVAGGAVQYTPFAREIDRRYFRLGSGDDDTRESVFMGRLDGLYNSTSQLDANEDHLIMLKDGAFTSVRGTGFQCASAQLGPGSFQCVADPSVAAGEANASIVINFAGVHPFYVGVQQDTNKFLTVQVPNIPDTTSVVVGTSRANLDFSSGAGDVLIYQGALPGTSDGQDALKVQLINTPSFVHASWNLGFPGGITIDTSNPLEVRLLSQAGNNRTVADFQVGDLSATWGFEFGSTTEKCQLDPPGCGVYLNIARVFFNFTAAPALEGFLMSYERMGVQGLSPAGPAPLANEYTPRISVLLDGFERFEASVQLEICLVGICPIGVILPNVDIDTDLLGSFNFDWWDTGGGFLDFFGDPDYITNDPWDFWPVLHDQADHLFPFGP